MLSKSTLTKIELQTSSGIEIALAELRAEHALLQASQRQLEVANKRFGDLLDVIDQGFCTIEVIFNAHSVAIDYRFLEVNAAFEQHTGIENAAGQRIKMLAPNVEEFWLNFYGAVALSGQAARTVKEAKSLNRWFEVHAYPSGALGSNQVGILFTDITARKVAETQWFNLDKEMHAKNAILEQAFAVADKASLAKSAFLSSMSHELRTPLNAILGFAQLLEIGAPPPTTSQKRQVDQILKAGWYLLDLINEVLDLSLIESRRVLLSTEPVALSELVQECRSMIEPQATSRGITLIFPKIEKSIYVKADRTRLKQVLLNLLLNAIKYNRPPGSVSFECSSAAGQMLRIGVRDTGAGLAPAQIAHLFQPFNRLGKESGVEEGTGIGLVVTKRLVDLMSGVIGVESNEGVGSLFWIELKLSYAPQFAGNLPAVENQAQALNAKGVRTLLYVEDNPANLELVEQLVAMRRNLRLISAPDGSLGVGLARSGNPDVILMDINLPGISGIQALQILQADKSTQHIPVIALSANAMESDIEQGLQLGFFHYLTKPIRVSEFMKTLDAALAYAERTESTHLVRLLNNKFSQPKAAELNSLHEKEKS